MQHWMTYVRYSYEVVLEAESRVCVNLDHDTEAYLVHLVARYFDKPKFNEEPVAIKMMEGMNKPVEIKKDMLQRVGDQCLLVHSLELNKRRWPSNSYYQDMGQLAYSNVAYAHRPPDEFFEHLANRFGLLSRVLQECRIKEHP